MPNDIAIIAVQVVIHTVLPVSLMWIAGRLFGPWAAIAVGFLMTVALIYLVFDTYYVCSAEPIIIPPEPDSGGEGSAVFPCDAPFGAFARLFIWASGPISVASVLVITGRHYLRHIAKR